MIITLERSNTDKEGQNKYTATLPGGATQHVSRDNKIWRQFMPGEKRKEFYGWYGPDRELVIGKAVKKKVPAALEK